MADVDDLRRIAQGLPEVMLDTDESGQFRMTFRGKGFAWMWMERVEPNKPRVPRPDVLGVRVAGAGEKEELLASDPEKFFTESHYNGFPAVLVRLEAVDVDELAELVTDAWRLRAPKRMQRELDAGDGVALS